MAISFEKYVRITSGVVGSTGVRQRELIGRIFTPSAFVSPGEVLEFADLANVREFFGAQSEEFLRAQFYFSWVSKQATRARKISFARYSAQAVPAAIYGGIEQKDLASLQGSTSDLELSVNGTKYVVPPIDLSGAATLTDAAALVLMALSVASTVFSSATVLYDAQARRFVLQLPGTLGQVSAADGELARLLGWTTGTGAVLIAGADAVSAADTLGASAELSNNFGSFLFMGPMSDEDVRALASWNDAQNVKYIYCAPVATQEAAQAAFDSLGSYSGTAVTLTNGDYAEMAPMVILAATDYARRNSTCNYMFQQFGLEPSVEKTSQSDALDALRANYYGVTQTAGQLIAFYQRGLLMGGAIAPTDMGAYANEIWLKDLAGTQVMSLLLSLQKVSANQRGRAQIINILLPVVEAALYNGAISVGKALLPAQKTFITEETGDPDAWQQVQGKGYWLDCAIRTEVTEDGRTEYYAAYVLIYSKDDVVRRVEGSHELI